MKLLSARSSIMRARLLLAASGALVAFGCASGGINPSQSHIGDFGVLVMAHGGTEAWNEEVLQAVRSAGGDYPVEVAFGMAAAGSLQDAVDKLEERGARHVGVVRLFVSGESWYERTRQILGISAGAPPHHEAPTGHASGGHHDFAATFWRIETESAFAMSREGLKDASEMSQVLLDRAAALSVNAERESVLILAHGPGDDEENDRWIAALEELAAPLRDEHPFRAVEVHTLREDWEEKREVAEREIRAFVEEAGANGGHCLVIPFRVFGFGPYAEVLEGLDYESDGQGLLPHEAVSTWIDKQADALSRGPFESVVSPVESPVEHTGH